MSTHGASKFPRARHGYEPTAVDEFIWLETQTKQSLLHDNQILHNRLSAALKEIDALKAEIATLHDASMSAPAVAHRITKLLHTTVEEISEMLGEAQAQAAALVSAAQAEADTLITDAQVEAAKLVITAQVEADTLRDDAEAAAAQCLQQAERAAEKVNRQQIATLQQLAAVHRNLANVPTVLESAYQQRNNPTTSPAVRGAAPTTADATCVPASAPHADEDAPRQLSVDPPTDSPPPAPFRPFRPHQPESLHRTSSTAPRHVDPPEQPNGHSPPNRSFPH